MKYILSIYFSLFLSLWEKTTDYYALIYTKIKWNKI